MSFLIQLSMGTFMLSSKFFPLVSANHIKHHLCFMIFAYVICASVHGPFHFVILFGFKIISLFLVAFLDSRKRSISPVPEEVRHPRRYAPVSTNCLTTNASYSTTSV